MAGDRTKVIEKYVCPMCPKSFRKSSLRHHLRQHTFERPFACSFCGANFTRQSSLSNHSKHEHGNANAEVTDIRASCNDNRNSEQLSCDKCGKTFDDQSSLNAHKTCSGGASVARCLQPDCNFVASTSAQLNKHQRAHGCTSRKLHSCPECEYSATQASHLRRHARLHSGLKPYACPHCDFLCASLENLRRHVLRSGRHPGAALYRCTRCGFDTQQASDLRTHLVQSHGLSSPDARAAAKAHLMTEEAKRLLLGL